MMSRSEKLATVYKITNMVNGMIYVGVTTQPLGDRFRQHLCDARNNKATKCARRLCEAICEFGEKAFRHDPLELNVPCEQRFVKENQWIRELKSNDADIGYNTIGGNEFPQGSSEYNHVIQTKYYETHKEERCANVVRWQKKNPEKKRANDAKYYGTHRDEILRRKREQYAAKKVSGVQV